MALADDLRRAADAAVRYADAGEELSGIVVAEPHTGERVYLCAYQAGEHRSWLALDADARPVENRALVRDAVSIAALCEIAEETAAGGDLDDLAAHLVTLRLTESPPGLEEAEEALQSLRVTVAAEPKVATPARLDELGQATRRLELALSDEPGSPFAEAMKAARGSVDRLADEVEREYKGALA